MATTRSDGFNAVRFRNALELGVLIRDARAARQWTQGELAERAGVGRQWLVAIERGRHSRAEIGMVLGVLSVLGVELFARVEPEITPVSSAHASTEVHGPSVDLDVLLDQMSTDG